MFNRHILDYLHSWNKKANRKPLVLRGARQVGKTTVVNNFGKSFKIYIYLNLEIAQERAIFEQEYTVAELISAIFFYKKINKPPVSSYPEVLIFIDEIQYCPAAVNILRYFFEDIPTIKVIAAGSLLETIFDTKISFPVGRVEYKYLYPLTFREYLAAKNETQVLEEINNYNIRTPNNIIHNGTMQLFHEYVLIGGMPEVVAHYTTHEDRIGIGEIYRNLLLGYEDDVEKYASSQQQAVVLRHIIHNTPYNSATRIKFQNFGQSQYSSKVIAEAMRTLEKALLIYLLYPTTMQEPPFEKNIKKSPRLQYIDTGLLNFSLGLQHEFFKYSDLNQIYKGKISEHIVGQELIGEGITSAASLLFWVREKPQSSAEIDYVLAHKGLLIPIEVKSGATGTLRSLHSFMEKAEHNFAIRLYSGKTNIENITTTNGKKYQLLSIPYYLTFMLHRIIDEYI